MGAFWRALGKGLAYVGKGAIATALWTSQHPQVLEIVATAVPPSKASAVLGEAGAILGAVEKK